MQLVFDRIHTDERVQFAEGFIQQDRIDRNSRAVAQVTAVDEADVLGLYTA